MVEKLVYLYHEIIQLVWKIIQSEKRKELKKTSKSLGVFFSVHSYINTENMLLECFMHGLIIMKYFGSLKNKWQNKM